MPLKVGHHRPLANAIEMAFRWRVDNGPQLNVGLVALGFLADPDQYC